MGKILVIGSGKSGVAAAELLDKTGKSPVLFDSNDDLLVSDIRSRLDTENEIEIYTGSVPDSVLRECESAVLSPGVPIDSEFVLSLRKRGIRILGEIELAYSYERGSLLAVTGTNGKTTTTSLLGKIISDFTDKVFVVGNIGVPYTGSVLATSPDSVTVAEISSFQLETIDNFKPRVSAILNITPDHLNRHHTMDQYIFEKEKIAKNQSASDTIVLNHGDKELRAFGARTKARVIFFDSAKELDEGIYLKGDMICMKENGVELALMDINDMQIIGLHNVENAMVAIAMAHAFNVPMDSIISSVKEFKAVEHRIEFVRELNGVRYYNDSKGTNVDAAIKGIRAMNRRTCLIGGGYDKGSDYDEWIEAFDGKVKKLVLIGATAQKIAECALKHGFDKDDIIFCDSFDDAIHACVINAKEGEAVLLSPACASWGMFDNYEQRGELFKEYVNGL